MTRFTKPTYEELEYKRRFHFVSVLNTAKNAQKKIKIFPLLHYTSCHKDVWGEWGMAARFLFFIISVPDEVD